MKNKEHSFQQLIDDHLETLAWEALRIAKNRSDAEDLVQDTLLRAWASFDRLQPDSNVKSWLLRIQVNTFISGWRKKKRHKALLDEDNWKTKAPWLIPAAPIPEEPVRHDNGLRNALREALSQLPPHYRECVELIDVEEKTYREAATILDRPIGTVMSRLHRARKLLQTRLRGWARQEGLLAAAA